MRHRRLIALPLVVAALASGCSSGEGEGSALDLGQNPGTICVPRGTEEPKTFGAADVRNVDDAPVTLSEVVLADGEGLEVVGARVLPASDQSQLVADGWPPRGPGLAQEWSTGRDAAGAVLQPGDELTLWVGVRAPSGDGTAEALRIRYRSGDRTLWQDTVDGLRIVSGTSC